MDKNDNDSDMKDEKHLMLKMLFPKRCPDWLNSLVEMMMTECEHIDDSDEKKASLEKMLWMKAEELLSLPLGEFDSLPSINDWKEKNKKEEEIQLISNYDVEDFIKIYGDPFSGTDLRTDWRVPEAEFPLYRDKSIEFLKQKHPRHSVATIKEAFDGEESYNLVFSYYDLGDTAATRKTSRSGTAIGAPASQSLSFLKEKRYLELQPEMARLENEREEEIASSDNLVTCTCCLSPAELLPRELVSCPAGHGYCKECVVRSAQEVLEVGGRRGVVECLATGCHEGFDVEDLEIILPAKILSTLKQLHQRKELLSSGLQNLVFCPFCPYMVIMEDPNDKIVKCMNPECSKYSCRRCHSPNHCPLSCEEMEPLIKRRKVEEELTKSVVRECWNCKVEFMRISACPQMTCTRCGADTCYTCRKPWTWGREHKHCGDYMESATHQEEKHQRELAAAQDRIKDDMEAVPDDIKDLLEAGPSWR